MKYFRVPDPVPVHLSLSGEPGVKLPGNTTAGDDSDTRRKIGIESNSPGGRREPFSRDIYMSGLGEGMDSCIRSAGAMQSSRSIKNLRQGRLNMILDCIPVRLTLPTREGLPVVRDGQVEPFKSW
jgi:hypothetical protein